MTLAADPRYHDLRAELDKLGALSGAPVDWRRVADLGDALARDQPPDLNVAAYTAVAHLELRGVPALCEALTGLTALLAAPPAALTPPRPRHRAHALEWLLARLRPDLARRAPSAAEATTYAALAAALRELRGAARQTLGDLCPSFGPLLQSADALCTDAAALAATAAPPAESSPPPQAAAQHLSSGTSSPAADAPLQHLPSRTSPTTGDAPGANPPSSTSPTTGDAPPRHEPSRTSPTDGTTNLSPGTSSPTDPPHLPPKTSSPAATTNLSPRTSSTTATPTLEPLPLLPAPPADLAGLDAFLAAVGDLLESTARAVREAAPLDPRALRLRRAGLWLHLHALPAPRPDGTTAIPGLSARDREQLATLAAHARWPELLARSESLLGAHRLSLDLQRHSAAALAGLGAAPALLALRAELRGLLTRLPDLPRLRDRDGAPLADPQTHQWLLADVLPSASPTATGRDDADFWAGLPAQLAGPTRDDALAAAAARIAASPSEHVRSDRRLALAEACERAGEPIAAACFAALADDLGRLTAERYDPELAARCLAGVARGRAHPRALDDLVVRLARLDPAAAAAALRAVG